MFSSCIDNNTKNENNSIDIKNLCNNQVSLLVNKRNNWKIPLDSIDNIDDFLHYANIRRRDFDTTNSICFSDGLNKDFGIFYTNVYPYMGIKGKDISLSQLLTVSSGGYSVSDKDLIRIDYYSKNHYDTEGWKDKIYMFY
jgi:hypothetical protein